MVRIDPLSPIDVSIIIRTKDEERWIGTCLDGVFSQDHPVNVEIIVVDSGSTDRTLEICRRYPVNILAIPAESFTYSHALNLGFRHAKAPLVISLSAHAIPADGNWLGKLVESLGDPEVAGACSREVPMGGADPYEMRRIKAIFCRGGNGPSREEFRSVPGNGIVIFSNVSSCIRKAVWEKCNFIEVPYAEDGFWAKEAIRKGHVIVYEPASVVRHSHNEPLGDRVGRELKVLSARWIAEGKRPGITAEALRGFGRFVVYTFSALDKTRSLGEWVYWMMYFARKEILVMRCVLGMRGSGPR